MFNATNTQDVHKQGSESDTEINYLEKETEHAELKINNEDEDETQLEYFCVNILTEENNKNTQNCGLVTSTPVLTDVCDDNGSEIAESIKKLGQYKLFGCVGHHINVIALAGFKQVLDAAS